VTGPGGREVDRVSVRVVPDTSRFKRELEAVIERFERTLRVELPVELDTSGLQAEARRVKDAVGRTPAQVPLDPLMAAFERQVRADLDRLSRTAEANIPVNAKGQALREQISEQIRAAEAGLRAEVPVDPEGMLAFRQKLAALVGEAERTVRARVRIDVDRSTSQFAIRFVDLFRRVHTVVTGLVGKMTARLFDLMGASSGVGTAMGKVSATLASIALMIAALLPLLGALAAGFGLLAGAVLAAGGAIGAALGGLPVLLAGIAGPVAAVALGMDGIKRAAQQLSPHVEALRTSLSATFEHEMLPVFDRLHAVFPVLERGLNAIAVSVSRFAGGLVDVVTSADGLRHIETALRGAETVLDSMLPSAQNVLRALLAVAGTAPLYQILADTIGGLADRFATFLDRVRQTGALEGSLAALRDVLHSAADAFFRLLRGAMEFFTAAGPGMTAFFDGLTAMFQRIPWAQLGEDFGRIFAAIGDGLARVPPETWQMLGDAVSYFADAVTRFVESGALHMLIVGFTWLVRIAGGLVDVLGVLWGAANTVYSALGIIPDGSDRASTSMQGLSDQSGRTAGSFEGLGARVQGTFAVMQETVRIGASTIARIVSERFEAAKRSVQEKTAALAARAIQKFQELRIGIGVAIDTAVRKIAELPGKAWDALRGIGSTLWQAGVDLIQGFIDGIQAKFDAVRAKLSQLTAMLPSWKGPASADRRILFDAGRLILDGLIRGLDSRFDAVRAFLARITDLLFTAVPDLGDRWRAAGADLGAQLAAGLRSQETRLSATTRGLIRAEDGTFVPPSFYTGGRANDDLAAALDGFEVVIDSRGGDLIARWVNRANQLNAAR
jgi:hypothetical protein